MVKFSQYMVAKYLDNIFAKHYIDEKLYLKKIRAYKQAYPKHCILDSSTKQKTANLKEQRIGPSGEAFNLEAQTIEVPQDMKVGCAITKVVEQVMDIHNIQLSPPLRVHNIGIGISYKVRSALQ